jgi:hypothetical protein
MKAIIISVILNVLLASLIGCLVIYQLNDTNEERVNALSTANLNLNARNVTFSDWELKTWIGIKNRLAVINTDPNFPDPEHRLLGWYSMRNSSSGDYYQKSMEFLCFWEGQGVNGEWEAVVSIYNSPNSTSDFVVEVSRFTWHSLEVTLDDNVMVTFPQINNDTTSMGYATFHVII